MNAIVQIRNLSKSYRIIRTTEYDKTNLPDTRSLSGQFIRLLLGESFNPFIKRREVALVKALDNVNLDVNCGEILGLFGENGSGKTTLLSVLGTMYPPDEGQITIFGYDYYKDQDKIRKVIIPMFCWLRDVRYDLTARQNIEYNLTLMKIDPSKVKEHIDEVVSFFELDERVDDRIERFSGGMVIKVALTPFLIAYLVSEQCLLLCDEPFVGLDLVTQEKLREFFLRNRKENFAMILATHQARDVAVLCDRVAIIRQGKIIGVDTPEKLIKTIIGKEVIHVEFTDAPQLNEKDFMDIHGVINCRLSIDNSTGYGKADIVVSNSRENMPEIVNVILRRGKIRTVFVETPTLEDALIHIMQSEKV